MATRTSTARSARRTDKAMADLMAELVEFTGRDRSLLARLLERHIPDRSRRKCRPGGRANRSAQPWPRTSRRAAQLARELSTVSSAADSVAGAP